MGWRQSVESWDAVEIDRLVRANWRRYLGRYLAVIAAVTGALMLMKGRSDWLGALLMANFLGLCLLVVFLSAWYGYRKWTGPRARRAFLTYLTMMIFGAIAVLVADVMVNDRSWQELAPRKLPLVGATLLMGLVMFALLASIANLRQREADHRLALAEAEAESERLARAGVQAELKMLQAQVEPHFLFNTLANVRYLVQSGSPDALAMLDHLIHYLRTALPEIRSEGSTLEREAQLARAYLEIMRLRMGGALEFEIDVPEDAGRAPFPPLMVITLVENAIKHGVAPVGRGRVSLRARNSGGTLRVEVEDNGRGIAAAPGQGVGLANIRERLATLFGGRARCELTGGEAGGALAIIEVPER